MTQELQSTVEASGIEWASMKKHIPCMAHIIQLTLDAFMSGGGVKGRTKSWEAHQRDQQFGENECTAIGKSQRRRKVDNARFNTLSALRPGFAKIIEKVHISRHFEKPETDLHLAENTCCIGYADTWSSKRVHLQSNSPSTICSATYYGCENTVKFENVVAWAWLPITRIPPRVTQQSKIQS